jgi:hypothetical protein
MENYKETIAELYASGKNCTEIGKILNKSAKTISYHLKNMGIEIRSSKKVDQDKFEELWNAGKSDLEIAEFFGVKEVTIKNFRTSKNNTGKFRREGFNKSEIKLTEMQKQIIYGSLLGDLSMRKSNINARIYIVHSLKQKELFMNKVEMLGDFMGSWKLYNNYVDKRTELIYDSLRGNSKSHPEFTKIYDILYISNKKTITQTYLNLINHPIALAYWFMDDGTNRGTLAVHSFSIDEIKLIQNWLEEKFNISTTIQKEGIYNKLYISSKSREYFDNLIKPYMLESMFYKLKHQSV